MTPYHLTLNKSALLFFPSPEPNQGPQVVQVFIRTKRRVKTRPFRSRPKTRQTDRDGNRMAQASVREITSFYIAQVDITVCTQSMLHVLYETQVGMQRAVTSLVHAHVCAPMAAQIVLEGSGYSLCGRELNFSLNESV